jgi:hypothetical protein
MYPEVDESGLRVSAGVVPLYPGGGETSDPKDAVMRLTDMSAEPVG